MIRLGFTSLCFLGTTAISQLALAVSSAEVYTGEAYGYGRFEARLRYAAGDGVISSFFLWKDGSEVTGTFWNELDFEKVGADCHVETNAIYGKPFTNHSKSHTITADPCSTYHTYAYEWTPDSIVWLVDGVELRRETGATALAFAENAAASGMQIHFNVWPGDATFGGKFSPSILPIHEYVDWVQFSKYAAGTFTVDWRDDFEGNALNARWLTGSWASPKNLSTHAPGNVNLLDGYLVVSLTQDSALGPAGASPEGTTSGGGTGGVPGAGGAGAEAGTAQAAGATSVAGATSMAGATVGVGGAAAAVPTSNPSGSSGCSISAHRN
ncbi:MAG: family 16 glycosylhydrolase, partial [Polyangiaceae bacterium]